MELVAALGQGSPNLTSLSLLGNRLEGNIDRFITVLSIMIPQLIFLAINWREAEDQPISETMNAISEKLTNLTALNISYCQQLEKKSGDDSSTSLLYSIANLPNLRSLNICGNLLHPNEIWEIEPDNNPFTKLTNLTSLNISCLKDQHNFEAVLEALQVVTQLQHIDMSKNIFSDKHFNRIAFYSKKLHELKEVSIIGGTSFSRGYEKLFDEHNRKVVASHFDSSLVGETDIIDFNHDFSFV